jgi:hypothetical protein
VPGQLSVLPVGELLLGASVYRGPVGSAALLFQIGEVDDAAPYVPDVRGANERILAVFDQHNIAPGTVAVDELPAEILAQIHLDLEELRTALRPPRRSIWGRSSRSCRRRACWP